LLFQAVNASFAGDEQSDNDDDRAGSDSESTEPNWEKYTKDGIWRVRDLPVEIVDAMEANDEDVLIDDGKKFEEISLWRRNGYYYVYKYVS